jgi:hypothetical protein
MGNMPTMGVDPDGQFTTAFTFLKDLVTTAFIRGGLDFTSKSSRREAWKEFDPSAPWSKTYKARQIDGGLFQKDPNRNFGGNAWLFFSRFTFEAPQTFLGNTYSHIRNAFGYVDNVEYYGGAILVNRVNNKPNKNGFIESWGLTLGSYINSQNIDEDFENDNLFWHEFGHTLQSRLTGPLYLFKVGIPSIVGGALDGKLGHSHSREWYETQANRMAYRYLKKQVSNSGLIQRWNSNQYPRNYNPSWYWFFANPGIFSFWLLF